MKLNWRDPLIGQTYDCILYSVNERSIHWASSNYKNPRTTYVWAHRFNLIIVDTVDTCTIACELFGNLETFYNFIGGFKMQLGLYSCYQKKRFPGKPLRRLKSVNITWWLSHSSALDTIFNTYGSIINSLNCIINYLSTKHICFVHANSLLNYLLSERFILIGLKLSNHSLSFYKEKVLICWLL